MANEEGTIVFTDKEPEVTYTFFKQPQAVGYWKLGYDGYICTKFSMFKKPTDEQIKNHYEMLGWEWEDA